MAPWRVEGSPITSDWATATLRAFATDADEMAWLKELISPIVNKSELTLLADHVEVGDATRSRVPGALFVPTSEELNEGVRLDATANGSDLSPSRSSSTKSADALVGDISMTTERCAGAFGSSKCKKARVLRVSAARTLTMSRMRLARALGQHCLPVSMGWRVSRV